MQHFSQSERDWVDTLRRLGRGEDPAAVRAALEQKRQDKYAPNYYADRTVTRAQLSWSVSVPLRLNRN